MRGRQPLNHAGRSRRDRAPSSAPGIPARRENGPDAGRLHKWKTKLGQIRRKTPEELLDEEKKKLRNELMDLPEIVILQLVYQQKAYEGHAKDYELSDTSMREHWQSGYEDTKVTLKKKAWMEMRPEGAGCIVHDVHRQED
ncbi:DUF3734 domain-containing protein [Hypericibacter sp.]|uniref:DUF3734 domain-containing protein n=1 Tax=Hypericibacter sp. TaxID=2705401 RepID=UPI003D6CFAC9